LVAGGRAYRPGTPGAAARRAGSVDAEIAGRLVVSPATAKTHVSRILAKLGLRDRAQLVIAAYESGLIAPGG
jgi:DNA-binding NarL/FixJ family response regulator